MLFQPHWTLIIHQNKSKPFWTVAKAAFEPPTSAGLDLVFAGCPASAVIQRLCYLAEHLSISKGTSFLHERPSGVMKAGAAHHLLSPKWEKVPWLGALWHRGYFLAAAPGLVRCRFIFLLRLLSSPHLPYLLSARICEGVESHLCENDKRCMVKMGERSWLMVRADAADALPR